MRHIKELPPKEMLRKVFDYNEGHLIWKIHYQRDKIGMVAGIGPNESTNGYIEVYLGVQFEGIHQGARGAHRLIYQWHYGNLKTTDIIDHDDGVKHNNLPSNLIKGTVTDNNINPNNINRKNSLSGTYEYRGIQARSSPHKIPGVRWVNEKKGYFIGIKFKRIQIRLGYTYDWFEAVCWKKSADNRINQGLKPFKYMNNKKDPWR